MSASADDQLLSEMLARPAGAAPRRRRRLSFVWPALAALLVIALVAGWLLRPALLWAYDVERAGDLIDRGMAWPAPRRFDSLPHARDTAALDRALGYLEDAIRRRPAHPQAYRLAGQVYAARQEWERAAADYERAVRLAPENPLVRWEASLVYTQMQRAVDQAPRTPQMEAFAAGQLRAPGQLVKSLFCNERGAASCYFGRATYDLPYAAYPDAPSLRKPALFLHPPASLVQSIAIPVDQPALKFAIGLDPVARDWQSDGATFRVWVEPAGGTRALVGELALDRATARRGWVLGWADLSPWAGQTVAVAIETSADPSGDARDDWYGWADLALTTADAARDATQFPGYRAKQLADGVR